MVRTVIAGTALIAGLLAPSTLPLVRPPVLRSRPLR